MTTLPCAAFEDAFAAVREDRARLGMIPIENSVAGRVADIPLLMPDSGLFIIGEHFERVSLLLMTRPAPRSTHFPSARRFGPPRGRFRRGARGGGGALHDAI